MNEGPSPLDFDSIKARLEASFKHQREIEQQYFPDGSGPPNHIAANIVGLLPYWLAEGWIQWREAHDLLKMFNALSGKDVTWKDIQPK